MIDVIVTKRMFYGRIREPGEQVSIPENLFSDSCMRMAEPPKSSGKATSQGKAKSGAKGKKAAQGQSEETPPDESGGESEEPESEQ